MTPSPHGGFRTIRVLTFLGFSGFLLTATHAPLPALGPPVISWQDKAVHALVYLLWAVILLRAMPAKWLERKSGWLLAAFSGVLFAGLDEITQGIPCLNRSPDVWDFVADVVGVLSGLLLVRRFPAILGRRRNLPDSRFDRGKRP